MLSEGKYQLSVNISLAGLSGCLHRFFLNEKKPTMEGHQHSRCKAFLPNRRVTGSCNPTRGLEAKKKKAKISIVAPSKPPVEQDVDPGLQAQATNSPALVCLSGLEAAVFPPLNLQLT